MKTIYMECSSGISGDMTVAALLDLGANAQGLQRVLELLPVEGVKTKISRVSKSGIDACDFAVLLDDAHENHDHDMEYLHGHWGEDAHSDEDSHAHSHEHTHEDSHEHSHEHTHEDSHEHAHTHGDNHGHSHEHRGLADVLHIISHAQMSERAKGYAAKIFEVIAEAEAQAHGVPKEKVHFHEVGAVDSIVDVIAVSYCLDDLDVGEVIVPKLCEGTGTVRCQHGVLPVPVPAVANIVSAHGLPLHIMDVEGEFVTPTGAAVVAAVCTGFRLPETFTVKRTGIGAGKRTYERPSILRIMEIEAVDGGKNRSAGSCRLAGAQEIQTEICRLESNIDDCTGENLAYVMDVLFEAGARDVYYMPVYMKKNRPAYRLDVICDREDAARMEEIIFRETTTIGIRRCPVERSVLAREYRKVETELGCVQVKICDTPAGRRGYLEYADVCAVAREKGMAYPDVRARLAAACAQKLGGISVI